MDAHSFEAQYSDGKTKISLNVGVYIFQEDNVYISYCPALDLSGYGETENAAKTSFGQTLGMYIEYCLHKNTLVKDLQKHGWKIKSMKQKRIKAPDINTMMSMNPEFREIIENKDYVKYSESVNISSFA